MAPWCSGLTCHPVTVEIAGSNPVGVARPHKSWSCFPFSLKTVQGNGDGIGARWGYLQSLASGQHRQLLSTEARSFSPCLHLDHHLSPQHSTWAAPTPSTAALLPAAAHTPRLPSSLHPAFCRPQIYLQPSDLFRIVSATCFPSLNDRSDPYSRHVSFFLSVLYVVRDLNPSARLKQSCYTIA